jgi:hypothetical protein
LILFLILVGASSVLGAGATGFEWNNTLSAGYDSYKQSWSLSENDTTETISEYELVFYATGKTKGKQRHNFQIRPTLSFGTEILQTDLDASWRFKPNYRKTTASVNASLQRNMFRKASEYSSDSQNMELRALYRISLFELRAKIKSLNYSNTSQLEQSYQDAQTGLYIHSNLLADKLWKFGTTVGSRAYPDSSEVNRKTYGWDVEFDNGALFGPAVRLSSQGERRNFNSDVRSSSWVVWNSAEISVPKGDNQFVLEIENDIWLYDIETSVWSNQVRVEGELYLQRINFDKPGWQFGFTTENLSSNEGSQESYFQSGVKIGVEHFGKRLTLNGTLEVGKREYGVIDLYTDFNYYEIWLMSTLKLSKKFYLDAMLNYVPENHSNEIDDQSLGFGSFQLVYRF